MAHSRLERIGTIYSRITGLIRTGAMKIEDRPIWYEVYQSFPPELPPRYDRPALDVPIKPIFYPEDVIRAKFHKKIGGGLPSVDLLGTDSKSLTQKLISLCQQIQADKKLQHLDEAFDEALEIIKSERSTGNKEDNEVNVERSTPHINVKDLLQETSK